MASAPSLPSRGALAQLAEVATEHRAAYDELQVILQRAPSPRLPSWVFALDRLELDDLASVDPGLHEAELRRRQWRVALRAITELVALQDGAGTSYPDDLAAPDDADLPRRHRFISVLNAARAGGCVYVNGSFQPVGRHALEFEDRDTFDLPELTRGPSKGPA